VIVGVLTHAYPRYDGDVAGAFLERLVVALAERGQRVHVYAPADTGRGGTELRHQVPVTRIRYAPSRRETLAYRGTMVAAARSPGGFVWAISLILRQAAVVRWLPAERRPDIVHAHWWVPGGVSAWLAGRPYVLTLHGMDVVLLESSATARRVARPVLGGAAAITAVSSSLADRAARALGLDRGRIVVQPMPIAAGHFDRKSRGGGGVVTVGRLTPRKRIDVLLRALARLRTASRPLPLTIVGDGSERGRLESITSELELEKQVRFLGEVPPERIPEVIGDADVFAFPALGEGFGLAAAEALLLGVPVVAAPDGGGVCDFVPASGAGRVVDAEPEQLARAIVELCDDPDARRLAAAEGDALRRRLGPSAVAERFESLYRQVLSSGTGRQDA
jgi:glycosyltransferase involved in cell wall biosynthesis